MSVMGGGMLMEVEGYMNRGVRAGHGGMGGGTFCSGSAQAYT